MNIYDNLFEAFQSTSSIQRKTETEHYCENEISFQSTSSIQRKTQYSSKGFVDGIISIHFLYTEEDPTAISMFVSPEYFNPLPLYRGRQRLRLLMESLIIFQSTSSIQRKTWDRSSIQIFDTFQSTSSIQRKTITQC